MRMNANNNRSSHQYPVDNRYNSVPPHETGMECAILGAMMIDRDAYAVVCDMLKPEYFYEPRNQKVYQAIIDLSGKDTPVDIWTVTEQLAKQGNLEEVGGPGYIVELSSKVASSANIEHHANSVYETWIPRQLITWTDNIRKKGFDRTIPPEDLLSEAEEGLHKIRSSQPDNKMKPLAQPTKEAVCEMTAAAKNPDGITGVASFPSLDTITAGFQPTDLVIVAARPAMGKTSFALTAAKKIALDHNIPTAFFSLEMPAIQLTKRLFSNVCEIPGKSILRGKLSLSEWDRLDKIIPLFLEAPLYIDDTRELTIGSFQAKAKRLVKEKGVKIIFVDYLQLMHSGAQHYSSRQEEVADIAEKLKTIATDLQIPIVALAQLNRGVENRQGLDGKRPQLSDLRESGAIEQAADLVLFVHRPEYYHIYQDDQGRDLRGMAQIIIAKHRKGATDDVLFTFRGEFTRFDDEDEYSFSPKSRASSTSVDAARAMSVPSGGSFQ